MTEAIKYFKAACQIDPKFVQAFDNLGKAYYAKRDFKNAQDAFEKALTIDPEMTSAQLTLGWVYLLGRAKPEKAARYFLKVLDKDPKSSTAMYGLGLSYLNDKNRLKVLEVVTKLRQLDKENLAAQLEDMLRHNRYELVPPEELDSPSPSEDTTQAPPEPPKKSGIKVRLRGKLDRI